MTQLEIKREALRKPFNRRRKSCPFSGANAPKIDYKDTKLLAKSCLHVFQPYQQKSSVNWQLLSSVRAFWRLCLTLCHRNSHSILGDTICKSFC
jgi:hypothetical protein